jgi:transcriptional regulator with XRE-family HTH domain
MRRGGTQQAPSPNAVRHALGVNVRRGRTSAEFTQEQLAYASGLPRSTITRIEKGEREPRISTLIAIAVALDAPLCSLLVALPGVVANEHAKG